MKNLTKPQKNNRNRGFSHFVLLILGVFSLSANSLFAQQYLPIAEFIEENEVEYGDKTYNLIFGAVPTISISDGNVAYPSETYPQCLNTDLASIGLLRNENSAFRTVKAISIKLDNESGKSVLRLNPDSLKAFPNLQYIIIKSAVPLSDSEVRSMISGFG
jgi:hypothetical protein